MRRLKYERLMKGWSLEHLGHEANLHKQDLSKFERGLLMPYPAQLTRLAGVFGVPSDMLMEELMADPERSTQFEDLQTARHAQSTRYAREAAVRTALDILAPSRGDGLRAYREMLQRLQEAIATELAALDQA